MRPAFEIGSYQIPAGQRRTVDLPISVLSNHTPMNLPVHVVHGRQPGPTMFVSAAVHGDEIIGVEIIRRLLRVRSSKALAGTLLCAPIVNAYGFISHNRYLPDKRDLNRSFPGTASGSLASQLAHLFMTEVVRRSDFGIDIHSASLHRTNLPQVRISDESEKSMALARAFGAPVIIRAGLRDGSLRKAAQEIGVPVMVFEGGEALRFDELAIRAGVKGILRVLKAMGMILGRQVEPPRTKPLFSTSTTWLRAPAGGILQARRGVGMTVAANESLGTITSPFGDRSVDLLAPRAGLIIGRSNLPIVNQGDALFHIAQAAGTVSNGHVGHFERELQGDPLFDEDEII